MKRILLLLLTVTLAACGPATLPATSTHTAIPSDAIPSDATESIPTMPPALDWFAKNGITLPTPACDGTLTPAQTEGPYYKAGSPLRNSLLEPGTKGTRLLVVGFVLDSHCQPISNAWLDFWQADANGVYDNTAFKLRGYQFTDAQGRYFLETVIPGFYTGRTEHIHVKLLPPHGAPLTTQLYFPGVTQNDTDGIFNPALLMIVESRGDYSVAMYNFVLP